MHEQDANLLTAISSRAVNRDACSILVAALFFGLNIMSYSQYEFLKAEWIRLNPNSTPLQYQNAIKNIARKCGV